MRELKNRLSEYLRRAQAGERIVVTSRGRAVATLSAVSAPDAEGVGEDEVVRRLNRMPWIRPPKQGSTVRGSDRPTPVPDGTVEAITDWMRGE